MSNCPWFNTTSPTSQETNPTVLGKQKGLSPYQEKFGHEIQNTGNFSARRDASF